MIPRAARNQRAFSHRTFTGPIIYAALFLVTAAIVQIIGFTTVVINMIPRITDFDLTNTIIANKRLTMRNFLFVARTAAAIVQIVRRTRRSTLRSMKSVITGKCATPRFTTVCRMTDRTGGAMLTAIFQIIRLAGLLVFMISART